MNFQFQRTFFYSVLGLLIVPCAAMQADETEGAKPQRGVKALPITRTPPRYPASELRRGRQGWVILSYVVNTDGKVVDPVVEDSSGSPSFERAALRTVEDWAFEPATWNGQAVQQCDTKVMMSFALEDESTTVTRNFLSRYRKIDKLLLADDLEAAGQMLDEVFETFDMTLSELSWYWALRARYAGQMGDNDKQLAAVRKATASSETFIEEKLYAGLLLIRTIRELESGDFSSALDSYKKLLKTGSDMPQIELLRPTIERIETTIASDVILSVQGSIPVNEACTDCASNWHYDLLRNNFAIAAIDGNLRDLEIRCSRQRVVDKAREDVRWSIPESWGSCSVIVFGDPGAKFLLLEEPNA